MYDSIIFLFRFAHVYVYISCLNDMVNKELQFQIILLCQLFLYNTYHRFKNAHLFAFNMARADYLAGIGLTWKSHWRRFTPWRWLGYAWTLEANESHEKWNRFRSIFLSVLICLELFAEHECNWAEPFECQNPPVECLRWTRLNEIQCHDKLMKSRHRGQGHLMTLRYTTCTRL